MITISYFTLFAENFKLFPLVLKLIMFFSHSGRSDTIVFMPIIEERLRFIALFSLNAMNDEVVE